jgi:hypothetical protein
VFGCQIIFHSVNNLKKKKKKKRKKKKKKEKEKENEKRIKEGIKEIE